MPDRRAPAAGRQRARGRATQRRLLPSLVVGLAILAVPVGTMLVLGRAGGRLRQYEHRPRPPSAPDIRIVAVMRADQGEAARQALHQAETVVLDVLGRTSGEGSEVLRLNSAPSGEAVPLSTPVMDLLRACGDAGAATRGAYSMTLLPLRLLWEQAAKAGRPPSAEELAAARNASAPDQIELREGGAARKSDPAGLDLEDAARGFAADSSADTLLAMGARGGVVEVGGNMRCFGRREDGSPWPVDVLDPFDANGAAAMMRLAVGDGAVCTSSHYDRPLAINGRSYSRVLDPLTGWPAGGGVLATAVAPTCVQARAWAEALRVLGDAGLKLLPAGVEAMLVVGTAQSHKVHESEGFGKYVAAPAKR